MTTYKNKNWPNEKQKLLMQVAFGDPSLAQEYFQQWNAKYGLSDLDAPTRAILPMVIQSIQQLKHGIVSDDLIKRYQRYYQQVWFDNSVKLKQAFEVITLFNQHHIKVCLLKGASMLLYYYKNMGMRPAISDFDILICKKDIPKAIHLLRTLTFNPQCFFEWTGIRFENHLLHTPEVMEYVHAITYRKGKLDVDMHWKCMHVSHQDASFESLFSDMRVTTIFNNQTYVFSPELQVFHTCVHGMMQMSHQGKFWWIMDILYILTHYQHPFDWNKLYDIAKKHGSLDYIRDFINYVEQLNPSLIKPNDVACFKRNSTDTLKSSNLMHRIQTSRFRLLRKPFFYISIYLTSTKNKSILAKMRHFPTFVRTYFGIEKSLFTFMLKKIIKNSVRNIV